MSQSYIFPNANHIEIAAVTTSVDDITLDASLPEDVDFYQVVCTVAWTYKRTLLGNAVSIGAGQPYNIPRRAEFTKFFATGASSGSISIQGLKSRPGYQVGFLSSPAGSGGGGGGGGDASAANQATQIANFGTTTDAAAPTGNGTLIALVKALRTLLGAPLHTQIDSLLYPQSANANSTTNLTAFGTGAGSLYTSAPETILLLQAAQVEIRSDQPFSCTVNQYQDAAGLVLTASYTFLRAANQPFCENICLPGNYFSLTVQNLGALSTTNFVLDTTFGIMPTEPYTLTDLGNKRTGIREIGGKNIPTGQLPTLNGQPMITSVPASQSLAATGMIQFGVVGGQTLALTLTNAPGATATWVATVGFQYTVDGTNWLALNANLKGIPGASAVPVSSTTTVGLWLTTPPIDAIAIRYNVSAWTSGTIWGYCDVWGQPNSVIILPFTPTVISGVTLIGPIEMSGLSEITAHISAATTTQLTAQGSDEPTFASPFIIQVQDLNSTTAVAGGATVFTNPIRFSSRGFKWVRLQCTTTGTVLTIQGASATQGTPVHLSAQGSSVAVSATNLPVNIAQLGGATPISIQPNGATNRAGVNGVAGPLSNTDYNAQAWAAASGSGATIANANGLGASCGFDINATAVTLGSAVGTWVFLQESYDNGTTFRDIWQSELITATGHTYIPAIPCGGRRRMRWININATGAATAATTVTITVTAMDSSIGFVKQVQWYDRTNNVTAGTAAPGNGASFPIDGCKTVNAYLKTGTATTAASYKVQYSNNNVDFFDVSAATAIIALTAGITPIPITAGSVGRFARFVCTAGGTSQLVTEAGFYGVN